MNNVSINIRAIDNGYILQYDKYPANGNQTLGGGYESDYVSKTVYADSPDAVGNVVQALLG